MQLEAVVFDYGNVISIPNRNERVLKYAAGLGIPEDKFRNAYRNERHRFDQGSVDVWEYWDRVLRSVLPETSEKIRRQFIDLSSLPSSAW